MMAQQRAFRPAGRAGRIELDRDIAGPDRNRRIAVGAAPQPVRQGSRAIGALDYDDRRLLPATPERGPRQRQRRTEEHTSELQSLMRTQYAVLCLKTKTTIRHYLCDKQYI